MSLKEKLIIRFTGEKPYKATEGAAAADLYADETAVILPGEVIKISTNTRVAVPEGHVAMLNVRSSLGAKGVMLANGTGIIDSDYRGKLIFALYNANVRPMLMSLSIGPITFEYDNGKLFKSSVPGAVKIKKGDRIGQLMIVKIPETTYIEVDELDSTDRGEGGFGSTGQ